MRSVFRSLLPLLLVLLPVLLFAQRQERLDREITPAGGGPAPYVTDRLTDEKRAEIESTLQQNIARLKAEGRLAPDSPLAVSLNWPVRKANFTDIFSDAISNFVDQNPANPGAILDWNCGTRTYDQAGYNHRGIDISTWPFSWFKMDNNQVEVIAAAAGTIIEKVDGNFDRNCVGVTDNPNMIFVRHADGSIAWYLHMKKNSLTSKVVGDAVAQGEFLGVVGSSGLSSGPHLHFELYNASNQLQDPFQGACNTLNPNSWWAAQEPYRNSRLNALLTHASPPGFPTCPAQEAPNTAFVFSPGSTLYVAAYYRDEVVGQQTQFEIQRPDGSTYTTWVQNSPQTFDSSYWYFQIPLPATPTGTWKVRATYQGQTTERLFAVGAPNSPLVTLGGRVINFTGRGITSATVTLTNATTGAVRTVKTTRTGAYSFTNVVAGGAYTVTASHRRFSFGMALRRIVPVADTPNLDVVAH